MIDTQLNYLQEINNKKLSPASNSGKIHSARSFTSTIHIQFNSTQFSLFI